MPKYTTDEKIIELVKDLHWGQGKSLRLIERENGLANDTIRKRCIKLGVQTKSRKQSTKDNEIHISRPCGDYHWRFTNPSRSKELADQHSKSMTFSNPMVSIETRAKASKTRSKLYKDNPTSHESIFIAMLDKIGHEYEFQFHVLEYIADFRICNTLIELDGRGHSGRKAKDIIRDKRLCEIGFNVVRIDQDLLFNARAKKPVLRPNKLISVIENLVPSFNLTSPLPPIDCKHRVVVRKAHCFTEIVF
jgi:very-short-patch-repair endonuclease